MKQTSKLHFTTAVVASILSSSAFAQNACQLDGSAIWIGGDEASSDLTMADRALEQTLVLLGGTPYLSQFSLGEPGPVRIEAVPRGVGDPAFTIFDTTGTAILRDDDSGGNLAARAETSLDAGTYCVEVTAFEGGALSGILRVGREEHEPLTEGVDGEGSTGQLSCDDPDLPVLTFDTPITPIVRDSALWRVELEEPTSLSITAENETADPVIAFIDLDGNTIAENDDFDGLNSRIDLLAPVPAGNYCLRIEALDDEDAPVSVTMSTYDEDTALAALYAQGEVAPPLDGSFAFEDLGVIKSKMRSDLAISKEAKWFTFDIPENSLILIEAKALQDNTDPKIALFDDFGNLLVVNDDFSQLDSQIAARVSSGTYTLSVLGVGSEDNLGVVRLLFERFVAAQ